MLLPQKENMDPLLHQALKDYVYDIVGYVMNVCKQLPCGLPEYIYQVLRLRSGTVKFAI